MDQRVSAAFFVSLDHGLPRRQHPLWFCTVLTALRILPSSPFLGALLREADNKSMWLANAAVLVQKSEV
jgi:hypothetical protein